MVAFTMYRNGVENAEDVTVLRDYISRNICPTSTSNSTSSASLLAGAGALFERIGTLAPTGGIRDEDDKTLSGRQNEIMAARYSMAVDETDIFHGAGTCSSVPEDR